MPSRRLVSQRQACCAAGGTYDLKGGAFGCRNEPSMRVPSQHDAPDGEKKLLNPSAPASSIARSSVALCELAGTMPPQNPTSTMVLPCSDLQQVVLVPDRFA